MLVDQRPTATGSSPTKRSHAYDYTRLTDVRQGATVNVYAVIEALTVYSGKRRESFDKCSYGDLQKLHLITVASY